MKRKKRRAELEDDPLAGDMSVFLGKGGFKSLHFEKEPKDTTVTLRVPSSLITTAKRVAKKKHMKYQRMMREAIVEYVARAA